MKKDELINLVFPIDSRRRNAVKKIYHKFLKKNALDDYEIWIKNNEPSKNELKKQENTKFNYSPKISIIVPLYNTKKVFFEELVDCLKKQTYSNWELCLADGSPNQLDFINEYISNEPRIKYKFIGQNKGISGNTNEALKLVTGDYIGLLDHDDLLPIHCLYEIVKTINENPDVEFIYSDEDRIDSETKKRYGVFFKPDFSNYTLKSANYICHFCVFKKSLMDRIGGFKSEYDGSQDFDIVLSASELTNKIVHIPKVLYHWRVHQDSTAGNSDSKPYAYEVAKNVIKDHAQKKNIKVEVVDGDTPGSYHVKFIPNKEYKVLVILDLREDSLEEAKSKVKKIINKTDYFNFEIVCITDNINIDGYKTFNKNDDIVSQYNKIIESSDAEYFIIIDSFFLDIDNKDWLKDSIGIMQDKDIGILGNKIVDENDLVLHSGIILGMNGIGDFLYKGVDKNADTYMQRLKIIHNVSCVYFKYAIINREHFIKSGKFDQSLKGLEISIDISLKLLDIGKNVILNPITEFKVLKLDSSEKDGESKITTKWKKYYETGDRFFSPNLSKKDTGLRIETSKIN